MRRVRPRFDATVAVSRAVASQLVERDSVPEESIRVIWNGVDTEQFRPPRGRRVDVEIRRELGLQQEGTLLIGSVGRLSPEKGLGTLLESVARLERGSRTVHVALVGDGPERGTLEQQASQLRLTERVHFLGARDDIATLLPTFDVFALPSQHEALPYALVEAMAAGRASVASEVGGVPEILDSSRGRLVPPSDVPALTSALEQLLDDDLRDRLGRAARRYAEEHLSVEAMTRQYEELYSSLLS